MLNPLLQEKLDLLEKAEKFECWYLVKHSTDFDKLCYLVSILNSYKELNSSKNLEEYIKEQVKILNQNKNLSLSDNYRALRVAAFFGLITMNSSRYEEADLTETFKEITELCNGEYEKTELYQDIIKRQIEKMFISSVIDEENNGVRAQFKLFPIMLLYKILLEIGQTTGTYSITMTEYRYLVATTTKYENFLETLLLINLLRKNPDVNEEFEKYRDKFDNRMNRAIGLLNTIEIINNTITLKSEYIEEVSLKIHLFESGKINYKDCDGYLKFLGSKLSLIDINNNAQNNSIVTEYLSPAWFNKKAQELRNNNPNYLQNIQKLRKEFLNNFSPEELAKLEGRDILDKLFKTETDNKDYLMNVLENKSNDFGKIGAASSYTFGLYYSQENSTWKKGVHYRTANSIDENDAISEGTRIRDCLVKGAEIIKEHNSLDSIDDYINLYNELQTEVDNFSFARNWVVKYYQMIFPEIFPNFYSENWLKHILYALQKKPQENYFAKLGQIALFIKECNITNLEFGIIIYAEINEPYSIYKLKMESDNNELKKWVDKNRISIYDNEISSLSENSDDTSIEEQLNNIKKNNTLIKVFLENKDTYNLISKNEKIYGICKFKGNEYTYDKENSSLSRTVDWVINYKNPITLPLNNEGENSIYSEIQNDENLLFLYKILLYKNDKSNGEESMSIVYETNIKTKYKRNRIFFGAPGTGKSFELNRQKNELLEKTPDNYERVTFHPNYSYANFVGTYKPVPCIDHNGNDAITYQYVPGPFMRLYVKALKNARTNNPQPFVLLIEEINRANVASVFGDIFQLLDRLENGVSEYPIQTSEDIKKYLSKELGGVSDDYKELKIPNNMFIWATMNSADQGVYPLDTAFKRRWDFEYLGINKNEEKISKKYVILGKNEYKRLIEWNALRKAINNELSSYSINEDKLLGPFFVKFNFESEIDNEEFIRIFKSKVLMYLFDDAAKQRRTSLFSDDVIKEQRYSSICNAFDEYGVMIFNSNISDKFPKDITE